MASFDVIHFQGLRMSEQLKYIVTELGKPPFNKNYNIISLDNSSGEQLLQVEQLRGELMLLDKQQKGSSCLIVIPMLKGTQLHEQPGKPFQNSYFR